MKGNFFTLPLVRLRVLRSDPPLDATYQPPDSNYDDGDGNPGPDYRVDRPAGCLSRFQPVSGESDHVVADRGDREALHGLLQSQLQLAAAIHLREHLLVLRFERNVDPGA